MIKIYYLVLALISAVGIFLAGTYWRRIAVRYRRLKTRLKRKNKSARIEWLEGRAQIHDNQNKGFHNRLDDLDEQVGNLAKFMKTRNNNNKKQIREQVRIYLKELQK